MDWTKAKNILIVALILTNLVLVFACSFKGNSEVNTSENALVSHLKTRNIIMKTEIPQKNNRMQVLAVKFDKPNEKKVQEAINTQKIEIPEGKNISDDTVFSLTDTFLEKCGVMNNNVKHDNIVRKGDGIIVAYKNEYEGTPIEESYIRCTIKQGKVVEVEQKWLTPITSPRQKKEVLPVSAALMKFAAENKEEEKIYIKKIDLVYWADHSSFKSENSVQDTVLPTWKITYNHSEIKYIPAFK